MTLFEQTAAHAQRYLDSLNDRRVQPPASLDELRQALGVPLTDEGEDENRVLDALVRGAEPGIMTNAGPRFFGFVVGGALPVSVAADWMAAAWDQNAGIYVLSPASAVVEEIAGRWLLDLLRLPPESSVGLVTGAQMANFTALAAARYEVLRRAGWDVNADGLQGAPTVNVIVGEHVHVTVLRALRYLGLGMSTAQVAAADTEGRMLTSSVRSILEKLSGPTIICAQAGDVNSGAFDPVGEIAELSRSAGAWLHVDGAFGLWAAASPKLRQLAAGAEQADSWATDAHKWLNVPQDCGIVIVRDQAPHRAAVSTNAEYLIKTAGEERDPIDWVPDFSRRARGFAVYAALRHLGRNGVAQLVERCVSLAQHFARRLEESGRARILNEVVLNQVLVRFLPDSGDGDEFNRAVIRQIQNDGVCWMGGTTWRGEAAMRISVSNWRTTEADIERSAEAVLQALRNTR